VPAGNHDDDNNCHDFNHNYREVNNYNDRDTNNSDNNGDANNYNN